MMADNSVKDWFVYVLQCSNGALYTGVTTDVPRRVQEHADQGRRCARFTRAFAPVKLVYDCCVGTKRLAYRTEYRIKKLARDMKDRMVSENLSKSDLMKFLDIDE